MAVVGTRRNSDIGNRHDASQFEAAGRDQVSTLRRVGGSQGDVYNQTARAARACAAIERARTVEERRVQRAVSAAATEIARLAAVCGSVETAGDILGLDADEVRRAITIARRTSEARAGRSAGGSSGRRTTAAAQRH